MERKQESKKLVLNRETIRELADSEMEQVAGAVPQSFAGCWTPVIHTVPVNQCLSAVIYPCV